VTVTFSDCDNEKVLCNYW